MDTDLFVRFWWLIFPIGFMISGFVRMILRSRYRQQKLQILKSYLDQGKEPPAGFNRDF